MGWRRAPAALLVCITGAGAQAPAEPQRIEIRAEPLSDTEQRRRDPVAKTIYGREELDKYGDVSVTDVLKRLPGVNMQAGNPRLRGLGAGYTLILLNGEPAPPGFSLENLPPSQVERIEVTKGPTAEYSTQAVAGTINIVLRAAPRQRLRELRLGLGYSAVAPVPSFNATLGDRVGDLSFVLPVSGYQWRGGAQGQSERRTRDANLEPWHLRTTGFDRWWGGGMTFGPRLNWKLDERASIESQTFVQRNEFGSSGAYGTEVLAGSTPVSVQDEFINRGHRQLVRSSLQFVRRGLGGQRFEARVGAQVWDSAYRNATDGFDAAGVQTITRLTTGSTQERSTTTTGKFSTPLYEAHTLTTGWDLESRRRRDLRSVIENGKPQIEGFEGEPFDARVERQALWLQDEWEIAPQWSTYLGLRAERIRTSSRSGGDDLVSTSQVVTPLWHLNYKLDPKGRDLIRGSLTRSYRAPALDALMARPSINSNYPVSGPNTQSAPDRVGNPALRPELSTGLDVAFERYFAGGGVMSAGVFYRSVDGLFRNAVRLEAVPWASVPRWVSRPVNLEQARSTGIELELKGAAAELLPAAWAAPAGLSLRGSLSAYRSSVDGIPPPDNRLEGQLPLSLTLGFDHAVAGTPLTYGANLALTPGYLVQQTTAQLFSQGRARNFDAYVMWAFSRAATLRLAGNNLAPLDNLTSTSLIDADGFEQRADNLRRNRAQYNLSLNLKF